MNVKEFPQRLRTILRDLPVAPLDVDVLPSDDGGPRYIAVLVSPAFEAMSSNERQRMAWQLLFDRRDEIDLGRLEFIFTKTPGEIGAEAPTPA